MSASTSCSRRCRPSPIALTEIVTTAASLVDLRPDRLGRRGSEPIDSFAQGDVLAGAIPWPTWPALALVPFGCGLLALRLAHRFRRTPRHPSLTGRDLVPLRPPRARPGDLRVSVAVGLGALFLLLAIGTPVGFAMAISGCIGLLHGRRPADAVRHPADGAALERQLLRAHHHPDVPADGGVRAPQRRRRRPVPGDGRLDGAGPRRARDGDGARRSRLRRDLRHEHGLGRDALLDEPPGDAEGGLRAPDGGGRRRHLGHARHADPAERRARHLRAPRGGEYRRPADRRHHSGHPRHLHHHGDGLVPGLAGSEPGAARPGRSAGARSSACCGSSPR